MNVNTLVPALLAFLGAAVGSAATVWYARQTAYERSLGEVSAKRRLDLVEQLAKLLSEVLTFVDTHSEADSMQFSSRHITQVLDELNNILPIVRIYISKELHTTMIDIHFWVYHLVVPDTNYMKPDTEPDYENAWKLLEEAVQGKKSSRCTTHMRAKM